MSTQELPLAISGEVPRPVEVSQKLSVMEKIGYSLGDLAANLIFQTLMAFLPMRNNRPCGTVRWYPR